MRTQEKQYLSNLATTLIQQLQIPDSMGEIGDGGGSIYDKYNISPAQD